MFSGPSIALMCTARSCALPAGPNPARITNPRPTDTENTASTEPSPQRAVCEALFLGFYGE